MSESKKESNNYSGLGLWWGMICCLILNNKTRGQSLLLEHGKNLKWYLKEMNNIIIVDLDFDEEWSADWFWVIKLSMNNRLYQCSLIIRRLLSDGWSNGKKI